MYRLTKLAHDKPIRTTNKKGEWVIVGPNEIRLEVEAPAIGRVIPAASQDDLAHLYEDRGTAYHSRIERVEPKKESKNDVQLSESNTASDSGHRRKRAASEEV